jgi:rSAM/selenodomain-associated transferase 1
MLQAVLAATRRLDDVETVVYWACEEEALPRLAEKYHCSSRSQKIGDLGQRMQAAFEAMFAGGYQLCCIIGSDAPDLPLSYIREAYQLLSEQQTDTVFGPSKDGGYYLLGMKQAWPSLFRDIPWSSNEVLNKSLTIARDAALATALLPEWQDIDTVEDLQAFQKRTSGKS